MYRSYMCINFVFIKELLLLIEHPTPESSNPSSIQEGVNKLHLEVLLPIPPLR